MANTGAGRGDSLPESYFVSQLEPGPHVFVGWGRNVSAIEADLEAGETYYVMVDARWHFGQQPTFHLRTLRPGDDEWEDRATWADTLVQYDADAAMGTAWLGQHPERVERALTQARARIDHSNPEAFVLCPAAEERAETTLCPADGV